MGSIIWLASYPKSGNTWFRVFLTNFLRDTGVPADINDLVETPIASARSIFDEAVGIEASELSQEEIEQLRPSVACYLSETSKETLFMKIHDAYTFTAEGEPLVSPEATRGAIYFIRNPLDVACSYAHHSAISLDRAIEQMSDPHNAFCASPKRLHNQLRQRLLTWSQHVLSWVDAPDLNVHVMRFEDMVNDTFNTFLGAVRFAELPDDPDRVRRALRFANIEESQRQEQEHGFHEKNPVAVSFFRKGQVGSWRDELTDEQAQRIINDHAEVMRRFGYLTEEGKPVY